MNVFREVGDIAFDLETIRFAVHEAIGAMSNHAFYYHEEHRNAHDNTIISCSQKSILLIKYP